MGSFLFGEGVTIFEGNRTSAREKVVLLENRNKNGCV